MSSLGRSQLFIDLTLLLVPPALLAWLVYRIGKALDSAPADRHKQ
jgi:hypothetical protein